MSKTPKPPAENHEVVLESGESGLEKLKDLARRLVSVPKKEVDEVREKDRPHPKPA